MNARKEKRDRTRKTEEEKNHRVLEITAVPKHNPLKGYFIGAPAVFLLRINTRVVLETAPA